MYYRNNARGDIHVHHDRLPFHMPNPTRHDCTFFPSIRACICRTQRNLIVFMTSDCDAKLETSSQTAMLGFMYVKMSHRSFTPIVTLHRSQLVSLQR